MVVNIFVDPLVMLQQHLNGLTSNFHWTMPEQGVAPPIIKVCRLRGGQPLYRIGARLQPKLPALPALPQHQEALGH